MGNEEFSKHCIKIVRDYIEANGLNRQTDSLLVFDVYVTWMSKTLQNNKALVSTTLADGMYYEITFNGDKNEMYFDAYKKILNMAIPLEKIQASYGV